MRIALLLCAMVAASAQDRVNAWITMADIHGKSVSPFKAQGKAAVVFFITNDCPICNRYALEIRRICEGYTGRASCTLVYVDPSLTAAAAEKHMVEFGHTGYPAVIDSKHVLVKAAGATVTPEAVLIRPDGVIAYRGRIDDTYLTFGQSRRQPTELSLKKALDEVLADKPVEISRSKAVGCYITPVELLQQAR